MASQDLSGCLGVFVIMVLSVWHQTSADSAAWTYMGGASVVHSGSVKSDWPGGRSGAATWLDDQGDLWLFGGYGIDVAGERGCVNDLWRYSQEKDHWYEVDTSKRKPLGRHQASACGVPGIMFVIHGGLGVDGNGLADTWVYSMNNNTWLLLRNLSSPSPRGAAVTWCTEKHMYIFGGVDRNVIQTDLWSFSLQTLKWTKLDSSVKSGENSTADPSKPVPRYDAAAWVVKSSGKLYVYGGVVKNPVAVKVKGYNSDMWSYDEKNNTWALLSGSTTPGLPVTFGPKSFSPGGRRGAATWVGSDGYLWLYGGDGICCNKGPKIQQSLYMADLWKYSISGNIWMWKRGGKQGEEAKQLRGYKGSISFHNEPGARYGASAWTVKERMYVFGGQYHSDNMLMYVADLWYVSLYQNQTFTLWGTFLVIFGALTLVGIFICVALYSRGKGQLSSYDTTKYSLLSNSAQ